MKRDYNSGSNETATFFVGQEVEHTAAYNQTTLFVVGVQPVSVIEQYIPENVTHIYFGANQSFCPNSVEEIMEWDKMVKYFLDKGYLVTLDFDVRYAYDVLESGFTEKHNFIPMISVKLPYINQFNYNAVVKIDDKDFKATNPGVWCHHVHELQDRTKFTSWDKYTGDTILK